jgi:minor extracellular serine protease Vpr
VSLTVLYGQPSRYSVGQEIYFSVSALTGTIAAGVWRLRILASTIVDGAFEMWLPTLEAVTDRTYFSGAASERTMTIPSTALRVIRVAGYNDRIGNIAEFSGIGSPNRALPNPGPRGAGRGRPDGEKPAAATTPSPAPAWPRRSSRARRR